MKLFYTILMALLLAVVLGACATNHQIVGTWALSSLQLGTVTTNSSTNDSIIRTSLERALPEIVKGRTEIVLLKTMKFTADHILLSYFSNGSIDTATYTYSRGVLHTTWPGVSDRVTDEKLAITGDTLVLESDIADVFNERYVQTLLPDDQDLNFMSLGADFKPSTIIFKLVFTRQQAPIGAE